MQEIITSFQFMFLREFYRMRGSTELNAIYRIPTCRSVASAMRGAHHVREGFGWETPERAAGANGWWRAPLGNSQLKLSSRNLKPLSI